MTDLRPCPFCGGDVNITYYSADNVFAIWHKYDGCKFIEPMYIDGEYAKSLSDARNIWNDRSVSCLTKEQDPVKPHYNSRTNWYECGNCHYSMTSGMHCRSELIPATKVRYCANCGFPVNWEGR